MDSSFPMSLWPLTAGKAKHGGTEQRQGRMNTVTCFPLQPFVLRAMSLNSEFFKAGCFGSGITKKKKNISMCFFRKERLTGSLWALGGGDSEG